MKSSNPMRYAIRAAIRFITIPHVTISAMCHSVTCVNRYSPCLFATRSVFALMSNSKIASQRKSPFEKSAIRSGSHAIGIGCLKCISFLNPYWESVQNFVLTDVSKW